MSVVVELLSVPTAQNHSTRRPKIKIHDPHHSLPQTNKLAREKNAVRIALQLATNKTP